MMSGTLPCRLPAASADACEAAPLAPAAEFRWEGEDRAAQLQALTAAQSRSEHRRQRRLARRLHEQLQQLLVAARLQTCLAQRRGGDDGTQQALGQVDHLLDQAMAVSRSLTIDLCPPVLYDLGLVAALEWLGRQFYEKHRLTVVLEADPADEPAPLESRIVLFEAIRELLANVVRHAGTRQAHLRLRRRAPRHIEVVVSDAGCGFALAELPEVVRAGRFGLLGIRERLEYLGGKLELESAPGRGTRVSLCVPRTARAGPPRSSAALSLRAAVAPRSCPRMSEMSTPRIRLLLVDDHAIVREGIASFLLEEPDLEIVAEARDGQEAVALALAVKPDVILMDVTMPHLDGIEATRRIKAQLPTARIIGLSMHDREDLAAAMLNAGASAYLSKDGCADTLVTTIRRICRS